MLGTVVSPVRTVWSPASPASPRPPWTSPPGGRSDWSGGKSTLTRNTSTASCPPSRPVTIWWTPSSPAPPARASTATGWSSPGTVSSSGDSSRLSPSRPCECVVTTCTEYCSTQEPPRECWDGRELCGDITGLHSDRTPEPGGPRLQERDQPWHHPAPGLPQADKYSPGTCLLIVL